MKRTILSFCLAAAFVSVAADDYDYLVFQTSDGSEQAVSVSNLKLTFANGALTATNSDGSQTFTLTDLSKMYFSDSATGISAVTANDGDESVEVYSVAGVRMGSFSFLSDAKSQLRQGVYVIKSNGKNLKISVK